MRVRITPYLSLLLLAVAILPATSQQAGTTNLMDSVGNTEPTESPAPTVASVVSATPSTQTAPSSFATRRIYSHKMTFGWRSGKYVNLASTAAQEVDTLSARGGSESPTPTQQAKSGTSASATKESASASNHNSWTKTDKIVTAHAVIGSLTWMVLSPIAIVLARWSRQAAGPVSHAWIQMLVTSLLTTATVALGCIATHANRSSHLQSTHQRMGISLLVILFLQITLGRWAFAESSTATGGLPKLYIMHAVVGTALSGLGFAQVYTGFAQYEQKLGRPLPLAIKIIWAIIVGLFSIYLILVAIRTSWKRHPIPAAPVEKKSKLRKLALSSRATPKLDAGEWSVVSSQSKLTSPSFSVHSQHMPGFVRERPTFTPAPPSWRDNYPQSHIPVSFSDRNRELPPLPPLDLGDLRELDWMPVVHTPPLMMMRERHGKSLHLMPISVVVGEGDSVSEGPRSPDLYVPDSPTSEFCRTERSPSLPSSIRIGQVRRKAVPA